MTVTIENLISREVHYCVSYLVSTLAAGYGAIENAPRLRDRGNNGLADLAEAAEQAVELASPIGDWEEAAIQAGAVCENSSWFLEANRELIAEENDRPFETAQELCDDCNIEPYQREVYEHWIVSDWLADKLAERGEKVDKDFCGMIVWARTCTGQGIASDSVIEAIYAELTA